MDMNFSGIKELYDVNIRLNHPMEIMGRKFDVNESILSFSTAEIAQLAENKEFIAARGGYHNPALVNWEIDKEVTFALTHGVLTTVSWAILSNSKIKKVEKKSVQYCELKETIFEKDLCWVDLKYCPNSCEPLGAQPNPNFEPIPMGRRPELMLKPLPPTKKRWIFCYDKQTGEKIKEFQIYHNRIYFTTEHNAVVVDYTFDYEDNIRTIELGNRLNNGFLRLDGKLTIKDQMSGEISTGILELPKIKLSSGLSVTLGRNADNCVVSDFFFVGYPDEEKRREEQAVAYITFLDKELTEEYI